MLKNRTRAWRARARIAVGDDRGFSLVELMVVVLIVAILVGIGMASFLGMRKRAETAGVKEMLATAAKVESALAADGNGFVDAVGVLTLEEPELDWSGVVPTSVHVLVDDVVAASGDKGQVLLYAATPSGEWYGIRLVSHGILAGRYTCTGPDKTDVNTMGVCSGISW